MTWVGFRCEWGGAEVIPSVSGMGAGAGDTAAERESLSPREMALEMSVNLSKY